MKIQGIMSKPTVTCQSRETLDSAAQKMWEQDCGTLAVLDEAGLLTGMITDRDICMAAHLQRRPLHEIPVWTTMSTDVVSCRVSDTLSTAAQLMSDAQVRRLPVLNGENRPVGLLSVNDIARYVAGSKNKNNSFERQLARTVAAISQPRTQLEAPRPSHAQELPGQHPPSL